MAHHYPLHFTLEDGVHVTVENTGNNIYEFTLSPENGPERHFTFVDDKPKDKAIESMEFDQLNAVRMFWLEQEKME